MMISRRLICMALFSWLSIFVYSQEKDFGIWYNITLEHDFTDKLELQLLPTVRTFDNASEIEEAFLEAELTYKFTKFLSATASYRLTENIEDDDSYHLRHKWFAGVKGTFEILNIDVSGRVRFERRYKTYFEDEEDKIPDSHLRFRAKAIYKTPGFPVNPYISSELFFPIFKDTDDVIDKVRYMGGIEYKIAKKHAVELEYLYQRDYFPKLNYEHILSVNYIFKF